MGEFQQKVETLVTKSHMDSKRDLSNCNGRLFFGNWCQFPGNQQLLNFLSSFAIFL